VVIGNDVGVTVLGLVHLQVGVLPRELLPGVDGLRRTGRVSGWHWRAGEGGGGQGGSPRTLGRA
jgi:hypothetical protein